jgi:Domain of unknown function (DUF4349)
MKNPIAVLAEKWRAWSKVQRGLVVVLAIGLGVVLVGSRPMGMMSNRSKAVSAYPPVGDEPQYALIPVPEQGPAIDENERKQLQAAGVLKKEAIDKDDDRIEGAGATRASLSDPLIARTAELAVATKEFSRSRTSLEEILEKHRAYAAKLRMVGQKRGSVLNATLRVPSTELTETVSELKSLGDVEREEQAADEVTQQRADLDARLTNAQRTLKRLQELLQKQTYPDGNVRELQRQIANASAEVTRLEAERQASEHRVIFANVFFTLREEVAKPAESFGAQLRSAAVAGFGDAMATLAGLLAFLIGRGPVVVLWCAILWLPARFVWKKWAPMAAQPGAAVSGD